MAFEPIRPFRCWCNKILPLVYDDSLSYYELLCKVTHHLNAMGENVNTLGENVQFMLEEFNKLLASFDETIQGRIEEIVDELVRQGYLVTSVNGQSGEVNIPALKNPYKLNFDGAVSAEYDGSQAVTVTIPSGDVSSVNGKTGAVEITASDVGGVPGEGWGAENDGKVLGIDSQGNVVAISGGTGAVHSVNGYTGDVVIDATDIGAVPSDGWSSADNGKFLKIDANGDVVAVAGSGEVVVAGVSSVNGQTGDVTIEELPSPGTLTFTGGASGSYDGSEDVVVNIPEQVEVPSSLPNPQAITFTGAVNAVYNGAEAVEVEIPEFAENEPLSFTGGVTAEYDGSSPVEVNIPKRLPTVHPLFFSGAVSSSFDGSVPLTVNIPTQPTMVQLISFAEGAVSGNSVIHHITEEIAVGDILAIEYFPTYPRVGNRRLALMRVWSGVGGAQATLEAVDLDNKKALYTARFGITNYGADSTPEDPKVNISINTRKKCGLPNGSVVDDNTAIDISAILKLKLK